MPDGGRRRRVAAQPPRRAAASDDAWNTRTHHATSRSRLARALRERVPARHADSSIGESAVQQPSPTGREKNGTAASPAESACTAPRHARAPAQFPARYVAPPPSGGACRYVAARDSGGGLSTARPPPAHFQNDYPSRSRTAAGRVPPRGVPRVVGRPPPRRVPRTQLRVARRHAGAGAAGRGAAPVSRSAPPSAREESGERPARSVLCCGWRWLGSVDAHS